MGQKFNQFGVGDLGSNTANIGQIDGIRKNLLGMVGPGGSSDDALFQQRLQSALFKQSQTQGQGLKNILLGLRNKAATDNIAGGGDAMAATNPQFADNWAKAKTTNALRPGAVQQQSNISAAQAMLLPETAEDKTLRELEWLGGGNNIQDMPDRFTEGQLMRAFSLMSNKPTGAGDSFSLADKMGLRESDAYKVGSLTDAERANQIKELTALKSSLLQAQTDDQTNETGLDTDESVGTVGLLGAKTDLVNQQKTSETNESAAKVRLLDQKTGAVKAKSRVEVLLLDRKSELEVAKRVAIKNNDILAMEVADKAMEKVDAQIKVEQERVNNIKAITESQQNEYTSRVEINQGKVEKLSADTELVETNIENADLQQINRNNESGLIQDNTLADTMLKNTKTRGQEWKLYEDMKDGFGSGSTKKGDTADPLLKAMGTQSGKLSAPLEVEDEDDSDIKYSLQPSMKMALAEAMKKKGQTGAFEYLRSLGKTPRAQIHLLAKQFAWPESKRDAFLEAIPTEE